jgi:folate-binding protein YgfZ
MKPEWKSLLEDAGAEFADGMVINYGNEERERRITTTGETLCDLSHLGLIAVYGEQAAEFLQNMLSNDIHQVTDSRSQLNSLCTQKGRMLSNFRIFKRGDTYYIRIPRELLESTLKRLQMFVLMTKVTLEEASNALVRFGYSGPDAAKELSTFLSDIPSEIDDVTQASGVTIIRVPGTLPRYEVYGELESMESLWNHLNVRSAPVGHDAWALLDILAGIPTVYAATSEAFVPQMTNMQLVNGVSFKKGCYPGQEIVARMQYLGKLKRRMYLLEVEGSAIPAPGDEITSSGAAQPVGQIVDARRNSEGGISALGVLQITNAEQGNLAVAGDQAVKLSEMPYAFEAAE